LRSESETNEEGRSEKFGISRFWYREQHGIFVQLPLTFQEFPKSPSSSEESEAVVRVSPVVRTGDMYSETYIYVYTSAGYWLLGYVTH